MTRRPYMPHVEKVSRASHLLTAPGKKWSESPTPRVGPDRPPRQAATPPASLFKPDGFYGQFAGTGNASPSPVGGAGMFTLSDSLDSTYVPVWDDPNSSWPADKVTLHVTFPPYSPPSGTITSITVNMRVRRHDPLAYLSDMNDWYRMELDVGGFFFVYGSVIDHSDPDMWTTLADGSVYVLDYNDPPGTSWVDFTYTFNTLYETPGVPDASVRSILEAGLFGVRLEPDWVEVDVADMSVVIGVA